MMVRLAQCLQVYNHNLPEGDAPMTQGRLARALGVSEATVSRWMSGQRNPSSTMAVRIARLLSCSLDDLLTSNDDDLEEQHA